MTGERQPTGEGESAGGVHSALAYAHNMARVLSVADQRVELAFDLERERWPWLALPPQHPVLLEKYQYFASMTAAWALDTTDPTTHAALTSCSFELPVSEVVPGYATRGTCVLRMDGEARGYELQLYSAADALVATYRGAGFAFTDRDFKAWRARSRARALAARVPPPTELAPPAAVGLGEEGVSFVTPVREEAGQQQCTALVTREGGFHPAHPFHTGSGDHVNVGHLVDCALQLSHLALGTPGPLRCVGGRAEFKRFVELDVPFGLVVTRRAREGEVDVLQMDFVQLDKLCTHMALRLRG